MATAPFEAGPGPDPRRQAPQKEAKTHEHVPTSEDQLNLEVSMAEALQESRNMTPEDMIRENERVQKAREEKTHMSEVDAEPASLEEIAHIQQKIDTAAALKDIRSISEKDEYNAEQRRKLDSLEGQIAQLTLQQHNAQQPKNFFGKIKSFFSRKKPSRDVSSLNTRIETLRRNANLLREELGFKTVGEKQKRARPTIPENIPPVQAQYEGKKLQVKSYKGSGNKRASASYAQDTSYKKAAVKHTIRMDEKLNPPKNRKKAA